MNARTTRRLKKKKKKTKLSLWERVPLNLCCKQKKHQVDSVCVCVYFYLTTGHCSVLGILSLCVLCVSAPEQDLEYVEREIPKDLIEKIK